MSEIKLVFISGPYRSDTRWGTEQNVHAAENLSIEVAKTGAYPVCPHSNTRPYFEDIQPIEFWLKADLELMRKCDAIIHVSGWKQSKGSVVEHEEAVKIGMPTFLHVRELKEWLENNF